MCHQTVSLVARHLEAGGISTVVIGSARDIVEHCGVPRFLFTDLPLGNSWDVEMQRQVVDQALGLLESATGPRTTVQAPFIWSEDFSWRERYARFDESQAEKLRQAGEARRAVQERLKIEGKARND